MVLPCSLPPDKWLMGVLMSRSVQDSLVPPPPISHLPPLSCQSDPGKPAVLKPRLNQGCFSSPQQTPKGYAWPSKATGCQSVPGLLFNDRPRLWSDYMGAGHPRSPRLGKAGSQVVPTVCSSKAILLSSYSHENQNREKGWIREGDLDSSCC